MAQFNKKGTSPIGILGEILIVLAVIFILLLVVLLPKLYTQSDIAGGQINILKSNFDKDEIRDVIDKCPCTFGESLQEGFEGCPEGFTNEQQQEDIKKYNSQPVCGVLVEETAQN